MPGADQFWTESTDGLFTTPPGGVLTTLPTDTVTVNEAKVDNATSGVSGDVHALTLFGPASSGSIDTFIDNAGGGAIHLYAVADMTSDSTRQATAAINGRGNDTVIHIAAPIVLEQAGGSDVLIDARGGNNSTTDITNSVTSTNTVDLYFNGTGYGSFGDLDLKGGSFTSLHRPSNERQLTMNGVIGSGVTDVTMSGGFINPTRYTTLVLANPGNAYTGDTILTGGRLRITTDTSLPDTTKVFISGAGSQFELANPGTDTISELYFDGVPQGPGEYSLALGNGGGYLTGSGSLTVASSVPPFKLTIAPAISPATGYDLKWESQAGMLYDVLSTGDLSEDLADWDVVEAGIVATPDENTWHVTPIESILFYRVREYPVPPVELLSENFDLASAPTLPAGWDSGVYTGDAGTTAWILGIPTGAARGPSAAFSPDNCVGTNIAADYLTDANIWLRTPAINLTGETGAKMVCQQWVDIDPYRLEGVGDMGTVRVLDADDLPTVNVLALVAPDIKGLSPAGWVELSADIPDGLGNIVVEFLFESDSDPAEDSSGWYIDDVKITVAP